MNELSPFLLSVFSLLALPPALPDEEGTKASRTTVRAADGLEIACESRGKGDTALVFIHGWCGDRSYWKHQVEEFAAKYRVVTLDLPGHGESGKDRRQWSVLGLAKDVEAVVKELGLGRVILVGHSMGGPISLEVARRLGGRVVGVIGVDTLHDAEFKFPEEQSRKFIASLEADFKKAIREGMRGMLPEKVDPALLEWIEGKMSAQDPRMATALFRDLPGLDAKALLKEAKVPVRCINSAPGGFQFAMPTAADTNRKYADFKAVILEGVGHFPILEKPREFNAKLREVLEELVSRK